ncbi:MAG: hypothetical protein U0359_00650 [Byssovorax sp.]
MSTAKAKSQLVKSNGHSVPSKGTPALPVNATTADAKLVDGVVGQIRDILAQTVSRGMDDVGRLLLREFFDDNPALYTSTSHTKHASLRLLMDRCESMELPVRRTFLANSLQLAVFTRGLAEGSVFRQLPPSHRVELLRLRSAERAESLAAAAMEKKMSVQKVREAVQRERARSPKLRRGRKAAPPLLKVLGLCVKGLRDESTGRLCFRRDDVTGLTEEQLGEARSLAGTLAKRVEELAKLLD